MTGRPSDIKANRRAAGSGKWDSPDDGRDGRKEGQSDFDKGTLQITTNLSRLGDDDDARGGEDIRKAPNFKTFCLSLA